MGSTTVPSSSIFRIFVSYASQDLAIATAVATCFKTALPDFFSEVNLDREFLQPGSAFQTQIEAKLEQTDVFIVVYSGVEERSHSFTRWEVGYFDRILRTESGNRKKISLYLYGPPATTASDKGITLGISKEQLQLSRQEFEARLTVLSDEPLCKEMEDWQEQVDRNIENSGFPRPHRQPEQDSAKCVRNLKLAIFQCLQGTVENVVKPQQQITIRVKGSSLEQAADNLPPDAMLRPLGPNTGSSMSIFGLTDEPITWNDFVERTASMPFGDSWRQAITSVVLSAYPDRVDVDNSQHILASDGTTAYRIILTSATKYYDDHHEYNIYFVELPQRADYGDRETIQLLKGLELVWRFRSMFLERTSEFRGEVLGLTPRRYLRNVAISLLRGLDQMQRDSQDAGIDQPAFGAAHFNFEHISAIAKMYRPAEAKLRDLIGKVMASNGDAAALEPLREEMADVLMGMERAVRPESTALLREMTKRLARLVEDGSEAEPTGAALAQPVAPTADTDLAASLQATTGATRDSGSAESSATGVEAVDTAVFCPPHVACGSVFLVQIFLYPPRAGTQVDTQARQADETAQRRATYSLPLDLPLGTRVDLHLEIPGLNVSEPDAILVWRGSLTAAQFEVAVPDDFADLHVIGRVRIAVAGVPAGTLRFQVTLTAAGTSSGAVEARELRARRYRRAFVSYSSQDRAEVLRRVQAFRIAGLSIFQDILDLDPGERWQQALYFEIDKCDVFLLFWSHAAAASEWVAKEIEYALARKGGLEEQPPDIQPVPIEGPPIVPPPVSLSSLHFNDALLAQIQAAKPV